MKWYHSSSSSRQVLNTMHMFIGVLLLLFGGTAERCHQVHGLSTFIPPSKFSSKTRTKTTSTSSTTTTTTETKTSSNVSPLTKKTTTVPSMTASSTTTTASTTIASTTIAATAAVANTEEFDTTSSSPLESKIVTTITPKTKQTLHFYKAPYQQQQQQRDHNHHHHHHDDNDDASPSGDEAHISTNRHGNNNNNNNHVHSNHASTIDPSFQHHVNKNDHKKHMNDSTFKFKTQSLPKKKNKNKKKSFSQQQQPQLQQPQEKDWKMMVLKQVRSTPHGSLSSKLLSQIPAVMTCWAKSSSSSILVVGMEDVPPATNDTGDKTKKTTTTTTGVVLLVQELLDRCIIEYQHGNPNTIKYANHSMEKDELSNDENQYESSKQQQSQQQQQQHHPLLNVRLFNIAMNAWTKSNRWDAPQRIQRILRTMKALHQTPIPILNHATAGINSTTSTINSTTTTSTPPSNSSSSSLLLSLQPDVISLTCLCLAWAKHKSHDAAQKAQAILEYMEQQSDENDNQNVLLEPNTMTYNACLLAHVHSNHADKAQKVEQIIQRMQSRHDAKVKQLLALQQQQRQHQQNDDDAISAAASLSSTFTSTNSCRPDICSYQSLIAAWSRTTTTSPTTTTSSSSSFSSPPKRAHAVLEFLQSECVQPGKEYLTPNIFIYVAVIHAWSFSKEYNKAQRAYEVILQMKKQEQQQQQYAATTTAAITTAGQEEKKLGTTKAVSPPPSPPVTLPNVVAYTAVLNACAMPKCSSERETSFQIAQLVMEEMKYTPTTPSTSITTATTTVRPNFLTYAAYLHVLGTTLQMEDPRRHELARSVMKEAIQNGQVGYIVLEKLFLTSPTIVYESLVSNITISVRTNRTTTMTLKGKTAITDTIHDGGDNTVHHIDPTYCRVVQIPYEWCRNVVGERDPNRRVLVNKNKHYHHHHHHHVPFQKQSAAAVARQQQQQDGSTVHSSTPRQSSTRTFFVIHDDDDNDEINHYNKNNSSSSSSDSFTISWSEESL